MNGSEAAEAAEWAARTETVDPELQDDPDDPELHEEPAGAEGDPELREEAPQKPSAEEPRPDASAMSPVTTMISTMMILAMKMMI